MLYSAVGIIAKLKEMLKYLNFLLLFQIVLGPVYVPYKFIFNIYTFKLSVNILKF